jgi:DNA mismatch repair protein MSH6
LFIVLLSSVQIKLSEKGKENEDALLDSDDSPVISRKRKLNKGPSKGAVFSVVKNLSFISKAFSSCVDSSAAKKPKASALADSGDEWSVNNSESDDDFEAVASEDDAMSVGSFVVDDDDDDDDEGYGKKSKGKPRKAASPVSSGRSKPPLPTSSKKGKKSAASTGSSDPRYNMIVEPLSSSSTPSKGTFLSRIVTPNSMKRGNSTDDDSSVPNTPSQSHSPAPNIFDLPDGVVGQGSHEHNYFDFLKPENRQDINGHKVTHPDYNPRTIKVPAKFLAEQTPAHQQWWQFKSQNMDTVLFFKVYFLLFSFLLILSF